MHHNFTLVQPYYPNQQCRKHFIDGKAEPYPRIGKWKKYSVSSGGSVLDDIEQSLRHITATDENVGLIWEPVIHVDDDNSFRLSGKKGFLPVNHQCTGIMHDIDEVSTSPLTHSCSVASCIQFVKSLAPELYDDVGMVVQASNRRGLSTAKNRVSIRIYMELSEPQTKQQLAKLFEPYVSTGLLDPIFSVGRCHLVRDPLVEGSIQRKFDGDSIVRINGSPLNIDTLRKNSSYQEKQELTNQAKLVYNNCRTNYKTEAMLDDMSDLAEQGYFAHNRNYPHYAFKRKVMWVLQDMQWADDVLKSDPRIIGDHRGTDGSLENQSAVIHAGNKKYFGIGKQFKYDEVLPDPKVLYLPDANLDHMHDLIDTNFDSKINTLLNIKSPHASGKTTKIIRRVEKSLSKKLGRPCRTLYVSTTRSIIRSQCIKLEINCYIDENDVINQQYILEQDSLGICLLSIHQLVGGTHFDLVAIDESEAIGMWAQWKSYNHNQLIDICANSKVTLLLDADSAEMTFALAERIRDNKNFNILQLVNSKSYIGNQHMTFLRSAAQAYAKAYDIYEQNGLVWVHTDISDKQETKKMSSLANVYNDVAGENIAIAINAQMDKEVLRAIQTHPNDAIDALYDKGYRIFLVSPIIYSGWRYDGRYQFTATIGIYDNPQPFITAPGIVQATQRIYPTSNPVSQHYMYITPASTYIPVDLEKIYLEEFEQVEHHQYTLKYDENRTQEAIYDLWDEEEQHNLNRYKENQIKASDENAHVLKAKASALHTLYKSNIKLHLFYYWQEFGGAIQFDETDPEKQPLYEKFTRLLKDYQEEALNSKAKAIFEDEEKRSMLASRFHHLESLTNEPELNTWEDVKELLQIQDTYSIYGATAYEIAHMLAVDKGTREEELRSWSWLGAPFGSHMETMGSKTKGENIGFYPQIGRLLYGLMDEIVLHNKKEILDCLLSKKTIVVDTEQLTRNFDYRRIRDNLNHILVDRLKIYKRNMSAQRFISEIFSKLYLAECKYIQKVTEHHLPTVKKELIAFYQSKGLLPTKGKGAKTNVAIARAKRIIEAKLNKEEQLYPIENTYLEVAQPFLVVTPRDVLPNDLHDVLAMLWNKQQQVLSANDGTFAMNRVIRKL